jgi:predicted tellurium resistance membrane protein TerC
MVLEYIFTLLMLIILQAVLGIDNLLYISIESKKAPDNRQSYVRKVGIGLAIFLRLGFLFLLTFLIKLFQEPFLKINLPKIVTAEFNVHSLIVYGGAIFIIYTSIKEIWHMIDFEERQKRKINKDESLTKIIALIVIMNIVFSFDSILSAIALTDNIWIMGISTIAGGFLMIWVSDGVSKFLQKNRMYEVLGLFILFLVGIMLLSEAGHLSHLSLFGNEIHTMSKANFYFIIGVLVLIDIVQSRYQKKLLKEKEKTTSKEAGQQ